MTNRLVVLNGRLSGTSGSLTKTGLGTLEFAANAANTYPGTTLVQQGNLWLSKTNVLAVPGPLVVGTGSGPANSVIVELLQPGQLDPAAAVTLNSDGLLDVVPTTSSSAGSLSGSGELGFAQFTVGSDNTSNVFSGPIFGLGTSLAPASWVNLGPVTANNLGALVFTDSQAGLYPARFFRFVYP